MQYDGSSVMAIFEAIASDLEITRAEISQKTGFSQVTVGKAVDLLDACGLISQYKKERATVGRKTSVCRLNNRYSLLILDFDAKLIRMTDPALNITAELAMENPQDALIQAFGCLAETDTELMGIGCVIPDGGTDEYMPMTQKMLDMPMELLMETSKAAALANAARFDAKGCAVFLRVGETVGGALMFDGKLYIGNGGAGDFAKLIPSRDALQGQLDTMCAILDPTLIHIACDDTLSLTVPKGTELVIEPIAFCRSAADGAAMRLREVCITKKLEEIG